MNLGEIANWTTRLAEGGRLRSRISQTLGGPNMGVGANCEESGRYIGRAMSHSASPTIRQVARSSGILAGVESRSF